MECNLLLNSIIKYNSWLTIQTYTRRMKKNLQKSAILFGAKSNAYLRINRPIFGYFWLFLAIFAYLRICSKSPRIYFACRAKYPCLFLPIFRHLTCVNISETATESLVKFMKLVLTEIGGNEFTNFPSTLYLAKKSLGFNDRFHSFVPCTKCHKLYNKDEVVNFH